MFTIKIIHFACFYATMEQNIFWGNLINSRRVFLSLKSKIRIMTGSSSRTPSKLLFQRLELSTLSMQYILFLMRFLPQNLKIYTLIPRLLMSYIYIYIYIYGASILDVSRSHTTTHHSQQDSSGRVISSSQRPLPDNTRHSQQTNIHAPGGMDICLL